MNNWRLIKVFEVIRRAVLLIFVLDQASFNIINDKGNVLSFSFEEVRVFTKKGDRIIEEGEEKEEEVSSIAEMMEDQIDDAIPTN